MPKGAVWIGEDTKARLIALQAEVIGQRGELTGMDDIVKALLDEHDQHRQEIVP